MNVTARSYCTGTGALEMAVRQAFGDFTVLSHSDIKPAAIALLDHHSPDVPNLGDMRQIDYGRLERADLMIGSWPCQAHSSAGKRLGEADPRDLWPEYFHAIRETRPAIWFGENVARITSNGELRRVTEDLARIGYVGAWRVLSAADVGACHLRKRCFVVAVATNAAGVGWLQGRTEHARQLRRQDAAVGGAGVPDLTLLPTPSVRDVKGPECRGPRSDGYARTAAQTDLCNAVVNLLPTPSVADSRNTRNATANRSPGMEHHHAGWTLCDVAHAERWGRYGTAAAFSFLLDHLAQRLTSERAA